MPSVLLGNSDSGHSDDCGDNRESKAGRRSGGVCFVVVGGGAVFNGSGSVIGGCCGVVSGVISGRIVGGGSFWSADAGDGEGELDGGADSEGRFDERRVVGGGAVGVKNFDSIVAVLFDVSVDNL